MENDFKFMALVVAFVVLALLVIMVSHDLGRIATALETLVKLAQEY